MRNAGDLVTGISNVRSSNRDEQRSELDADTDLDTVIVIAAGYG